MTQREEHSQTVKRIKVQYFAVFREAAGRSKEEVETSARTAGELLAELRSRYGFQLPDTLVRCSINLQFKPLDHPLRDGDEVVFIPPVAGG